MKSLDDLQVGDDACVYHYGSSDDYYEFGTIVRRTKTQFVFCRSGGKKDEETKFGLRGRKTDFYGTFYKQLQPITEEAIVWRERRNLMYRLKKIELVYLRRELTNEQMKKLISFYEEMFELKTEKE